MPDWQPAYQQLVPAPPAPLVQPGAAPRITPAPEGHADHKRAWSRDGAQMTPELLQDTKPYLQAVMSMGRDFKVSHSNGKDAEKTVKMMNKLMKQFRADNPLPENATQEQREAHGQAATALLQNFREKLPMQREVHDATRKLRDRFKNVTADTYTPDKQAEFEAAYAELREQTGRHEPSLLEQALPQDSPLRTKLDPLTGGLRDPSTGLYANMVQMGEGAAQKNVLIFGGTGVGGSTKAQVVVDAGQFLGGVPKAYQQAAELTAQVSQGLETLGSEAALETAGHSLGGGLANYAALKNGGIQATCFNAAALGGGCKASIGDNLSEAKTNVRHINVDGDGVGDGIGKLRRPVQQAADGVNSLRSAVNLKVTNAKAIGQGVIDLAVEKAEPLRQAVQPAVETAKQIGTTVAGGMQKAGVAMVGGVQKAGGAVVEGVQKAGGVVAEVANEAKEAVGGAAQTAWKAASNTAVGQTLKETAQTVANSPVGKAVGEGVETAKETLEKAKAQVSKGVETTKTSVREMMQGLKKQAGDLKQGIKETAKEIGDGIKESSVGKKAGGALQAVVNLHDDLAPKNSKLAIPHQYGGCVTLPNGGQLNPLKNNPIENHLTGALAKAYERSAQQNVAVRAQVAIGGQRQSGGRGIGV